MAYNDHSEFPRGTFSVTDLTNTAVDVGTPGVAVRVAGGVLSGGAAAESVIFRNSAGTVEYFRLPVPANGTVQIPRFYAATGLEVLTASLAGDVGVTITYYDD